MCGRYTVYHDALVLQVAFGLAKVADLAPRYNVAPSQSIPVVRVANGKRELAALTWGLIPHWSESPKRGGFVNARAETVPEKPAFRDPFRHRRCLVPADGFFEWRHQGKKKHPYFFRILMRKRRAGFDLIALARVAQ